MNKFNKRERPICWKLQNTAKRNFLQPKQRDTECSLTGRFYPKIATLCIDLQIQCNPLNVPARVLGIEIDMMILKSIWKCNRSRISKIIFKTKTKQDFHHSISKLARKLQCDACMMTYIDQEN